MTTGKGAQPSQFSLSRTCLPFGAESLACNAAVTTPLHLLVPALQVLHEVGCKVGDFTASSTGHAL